MRAYGRALDLRHLAWGLEHKSLVESLADSLNRCNNLLTAEIIASINDYPEWLPDQEPLCEGEIRTFRKQCEDRQIDPDRCLEVLHVLDVAVQQMEGASAN
jgi:hypothetical protein